jgi:diguanylate cyclase (GGDEF)-like protein
MFGSGSSSVDARLSVDLRPLDVPAQREPSGVRLLVVDDELANLDMLGRILVGAGYETVEFVQDPRQALARYRSFGPDLVLLDLRMPHMDGLTVLGQIRREIPAADFVPIAVLTGDSSVESRRRALSAGAQDFIVKPFDPTEVILRIGGLLRLRSMHTQLRRANADLEHKVAARTRELASERQFLSAVLDSLSEAIIATDADGSPRLANPAVDQLSVPIVLRSIARADGRGSATPQVWLADGRPLAAEEMPLELALHGDIVRNLELTTLGADGVRRSLVASATPIAGPGEERPAAVLVLRDVTDRRRVEDELRHRALHDGLTGLPNRALFLDRLSHSLSGLERGGGSLAVLFIDVDGFKAVNDTLGHAGGDFFLSELGRRLVRTLRPGDTAARFGGDEFAVLCERLGDLESAAEIAGRVRHALAVPMTVEHLVLTPAVSVGITVAVDMERSSDELVRDADVAMFRAKELGGDRHEVFEQALRQRLLHRLDLEQALRTGIESEQLVVHYQPKVSLATGAVTGAEALVRWNRPQHGLLLPEDFIDVAERTGLVGAVDTWVLQTACKQLAAWRRQVPHLEQLTIAVNVSPVELADASLSARILSVLADTGLPPSALCLEVTETTLMKDPPAAVRLLTELTELGVLVAIDDFGTGYSSLAYLRQLPAHTLKIDRAFVRGLPNQAGDSAVVTAIVGLATALGLRTVAEGVETQGQVDLLRDLGCHEAQGYYFSRPVTAEALAQQFAWEPDGWPA